MDPLDSEAGQLMAIRALRYSISYTASANDMCREWIRDTWPLFYPVTRRTMLRYVAEGVWQLSVDLAHGDSPADRWKKLGDWMIENMDRADVKRARQEVATDGVAWLFTPW